MIVYKHKIRLLKRAKVYICLLIHFINFIQLIKNDQTKKQTIIIQHYLSNNHKLIICLFQHFYRLIFTQYCNRISFLTIGLQKITQ